MTGAALSLPFLGLGTWMMGERPRERSREVAALRAGLEAGAELIDTAEMYADGESESIVGEALKGFRDQVFLVSKVLPSNAGRQAVMAACDRSRRRLGVDCIDLYLLHWPGSVPLSETISGFEALQRLGAIKHWGVSNFDASALAQLLATEGGTQCRSNQIYFSLSERGPEFDLLPMHHQHGITTMAYCPLDQGDLTSHPDLLSVALSHQASCAQIALAWLRQRGITAIPKSARAKVVLENLGSLNITLSPADLALIDQVFPPPQRAERLKIV
ncbi:MAG: aldo/keto reductase [Burkholderiaceae bacterium]